MDEKVIATAKSLLHDPVMAEQLAVSGYTTFPFLGSADVQKLTEYYYGFQKEEPAHFYSSTHAKDPAFRRTTSDHIKSIISPLMSSMLKNYRLLGGAFVVKPPHGKGVLQPHQDWNIVDEENTRSFNLWIPLTDVNVENGAVFVLPGSHAKIKTYRGPGIPSIFKNIEPAAWQSLQPLIMKAGEALFYDHALLHGSPANQTNAARLGIVCGVITATAEMQLCFQKDQHIDLYKADEHFFMEKDPNGGPDGLQFIRSVTPAHTNLSEEDYNTMFLGKPELSRHWLKKLFAIRRS
ncbi:hypothetical protein CNR22_03980 [Sphingobacteriaceae bacterium]|nr:hypothetical protein CNR22_03980 [Sphingobacteriaceae bacterium]